MTLQKIISLGFIVSSLMVSAQAANLGKATKVIGHVTKIAQESMEEKPLKVDDDIAPRDTIVTLEKSMAQVILVDGSVLTFGPKTKFNFRNMIYDEKKKRIIEFDLLYGQLRGTISKKSSKENRVKVDTRTVSMGVRGTEILMNNKVEDVKSEVSEVALLSGDAQVRYKKSGKIFKLKPGDYMVAMNDPGLTHIPAKSSRMEDRVFQALASTGLGGGGPSAFKKGVGNDMALAGTRDASKVDPNDSQIPEGYFLDLGKGDELLKK